MYLGTRQPRTAAKLATFRTEHTRRWEQLRYVKKKGKLHKVVLLTLKRFRADAWWTVLELRLVSVGTHVIHLGEQAWPRVQARGSKCSGFDRTILEEAREQRIMGCYPLPVGALASSALSAVGAILYAWLDIRAWPPGSFSGTGCTRSSQPTTAAYTHLASWPIPPRSKLSLEPF